MPLTLETDLIDRRVVADAGNDILKLPAAGLMEQHVVGDDRLHLEMRRQIGQFV